MKQIRMSNIQQLLGWRYWIPWSSKYYFRILLALLLNIMISLLSLKWLCFVKRIYARIFVVRKRNVSCNIPFR